jgi:glycosyltransferase involved in cell wall biosynthesis
VPEVIEHGTTGYIVDDMDEAVDAARRVGALDRRACRDAFEQRFTADLMARRYVEVYAALSAARGVKRAADDAPAQLSD